MLQGPGENAGAVDIGDGLAAVFKIESHNHPSFIEPYQGAATGVGGIIRDIFTMGARPIALLNSLRFGVARRAGHAAAARGRRRRHRRLRQQHRHPDGRRRDRVRAVVRRQSARQRLLPRHREGVGHHQGRRVGRRQPRLLRRREDRPRRHPRRDDGVGGVRRQVGGEAAGGAGRRSVHGEAAARGLPRGDADRRARRHPGHGRGRADLLDDRDGIARRRRRRDRRRARAAARDRHDAVRDHAVRVAGAHAARRQEGPRSRGRAHLREVGPARRAHRRGDRRRDAAREGARAGRRRDSEPRADRRSAGLPAADGDAGVPGRGAAARSRRARGRRRRCRPPTTRCWRCSRRRRSRASAGSTGSTTTWCRPTPSTCPGSAPASCASRAPTARWRCRSTATAATATSIRGAARCWRWPRPRATSRAPARGRSARPTASTSAIRSGRRSCGSSRRRSRASARRAGRSTCRSPAATSASTTRPTASAIYPTPVIGVVGLLEHADRVRRAGGSRSRATSIVLLGEGRGELGGSEYLKVVHGLVRGVPPALDLDAERALQALLVALADERLVRSAHDCSDGGLAVTLAECCFDTGGHRRRGVDRRREQVARDPRRERRGGALRRVGVARGRVGGARRRDRGARSGRRPRGVPARVIGRDRRQPAADRGRRRDRHRSVRWTTPSARGRRRSSSTSRSVWPEEHVRQVQGRVRRLRHLRSSRSRQHDLPRPLRAAAPRPGERRHCRVGRRAGPRRRGRWATSPTSSTARRSSQLPGPTGDRPRALLDGRREPLLECAADPDRLRARPDRASATTATSSTRSELRDELVRQGSIFQSSSDTEVVLHLYARSKARSVEDAVVESVTQVQGAFSFVMLTQGSADRGPRSAWLPAAGARPARRRRRRLLGDLRDGSHRRHLRARRRAGRGAGRSAADGLRSIKPFPPAPLAHCVFEHVYFARPDSYVFGKSVNEVRTEPRPHAGARAARRRRRRRAGARLGRLRGDGLRRARPAFRCGWGSSAITTSAARSSSRSRRSGTSASR